MKRSVLVGSFAAAIATMLLAAPALAHGDHDARPLVRDLEAGPYVVSLWQVYPDIGSAMTPHLIVMVEGAAIVASTGVAVTVDGAPMEVRPSATTTNGWETTEGLVEGDMVGVTISDGSQSWVLDPVVVTPSPTSMLPMQELIWVAIAMTAATAVWLAGRTARTWRRPTVGSIQASPIK